MLAEGHKLKESKTCLIYFLAQFSIDREFCNGVEAVQSVHSGITFWRVFVFFSLLFFCFVL